MHNKVLYNNKIMDKVEAKSIMFYTGTPTFVLLYNYTLSWQFIGYT